MPAVTIRDLSTIDITDTTQENVTGLVAVVVDWEPESLRLAQLAVKLSAMRSYGEVLTAFGGAWLPPDEESGLPDFRIRLGPEGLLVVAAAGKVRKFLRNGPGDAVHPLAEVVAERL